MVKKIFSITILLSAYLITCLFIYNSFNTTIRQPSITTIPPVTETLPITSTKQEISTEINYQRQKDQTIGKLIIPKITLNEELYPINSQENTIEKNVTILHYSQEPSIKNSIIFIAAHSGTGNLAYFKNLHKLNINDHIILEYKNITYEYQIKDIWEIPKNGNISVEKENINQLVLTTCSPTKDNYQLIINSVLTKKEF